MFSKLVVLDVFFVSLALFLTQQWFARKRSRSLLPPGPTPLPLLGNVLDMPASYQWKTFAEWGKTWGDVSSITVFGQRIVILSTVEVAVDLLEKRGAIYSDRPKMPMVGELMTWAQSLVFSPYGLRFRDIRRLLHRYLGSRGQLEKTEPFHALEEMETRRFLAGLLREPEHFVKHIRKTAGAIILNMAYGYEVQDGEDPLVELVDRAVRGFIAASQPGSFLVDAMPFLQHVPSWFPGTAWKRKGAEWRAETLAMGDVPFAMAKEEAIRGSGKNNFVSDNLSQVKTPLQDYHLKMAAGALYSGGADTTVSAITTFFLAMTLHPEVQKRAQREIDAVIGTGRLPTIADRDSLPYMRALVSEVFRWNPIAPLGVPHRSIEDDTYQGHFLPKGSIFIANIWYMLRDPDVYSEPLEFKPERFLGDESERDPRCAVFGFGRRICPGLNLAETSVFISCAMTLAVFNIQKTIKDGREITPEVAYDTGTISHPLPFKCTIKPRSAKAQALITV